MPYLWVNLCDIQSCGVIPNLGSPLMWMVQSRLGDRLLNYVAMSSHGAADDEYLVVECSEDRALAMKDAMELIGVRKMKRKIRTRITAGEPTDAWRRLLFRNPVIIKRTSIGRR
jgi:hypothetical protein